MYSKKNYQGQPGKGQPEPATQKTVPYYSDCQLQPGDGAASPELLPSHVPGLVHLADDAGDAHERPPKRRRHTIQTTRCSQGKARHLQSSCQVTLQAWCTRAQSTMRVRVPPVWLSLIVQAKMCGSLRHRCTPPKLAEEARRWRNAIFEAECHRHHRYGRRMCFCGLDCDVASVGHACVPFDTDPGSELAS